MTYNPSIPQALDRISDSQPQLLANFTQLNTKYGTSGDHYAWNNANPGESNMHAKVTLPVLPTATAPGNAIPNPAAGTGVIYGSNSVGVTVPVWARDAAGNPRYNLASVRSFVTFDAAGAIIGSMNTTNVVRNSAGNFTVTMPAGSLPDSNYTLLISSSRTAGNSAITSNFLVQNANSYVIFLFTLVGAATDPGQWVSAVVLRN